MINVRRWADLAVSRQSWPTTLITTSQASPLIKLPVISFVIDDAYLPATLNAQPMSDGEFAAFCAEHTDLSFEMTAEGELIVMPPTEFLSGARNGARRSPDAPWVLNSRIGKIDPSKDRFLHLCPDFVVELKSDSDRPGKLQQKMLEYMDNGAQLGWLIDLAKRSVTIYRPNCEPKFAATSIP